MADNYFRQLSEAGLTAIAWVLPRSMEALEDTRKLWTLLEQPLVGAFNDPEAAYNWLLQ